MKWCYQVIQRHQQQARHFEATVDAIKVYLLNGDDDKKMG